MSFCRFSLLRELHVPKLACQKLAFHRTHGAFLSPNFCLQERVWTQNKPSPNVSRSTTNMSSPSIPKRYYSDSIGHEEDANHGLTEEKYERLHRTHRIDIIKTLTPASYLQVLSEAIARKRRNSAEHVILDIFNHYKGTEDERRDLLRKVLALDLRILRKDFILRILQHLHQFSEDGLRFLKSSGVAGIGLMLLDSEKSSTDRLALRLLHPLLLTHLEAIKRPRHLTPTYPPSIIIVSFRAMYKLLDMTFDRHALELFQALLKLGFIPVEALPPSIDPTLGDPKALMLSALIKAALHWNWFHLARDCMLTLIKLPTPAEWVVKLNLDVINALLDNQNHDNIKNCLHLILGVHRLSPVPDAVIRRFYTSAAASLAKEEAEELYTFTRSPRVHRVHRYPTPPPNVIPWLMGHLTTKSRQPHLARTLATEVAENHLAIPRPFRAQFVASVAQMGYGRLARDLWSRFADGADAAVIVGNSALMLRMVSLLNNVRRGIQQDLNGSRTELPSNRSEKLHQRLTEVSESLGRVLDSFKAHHAPLNKAPHRELTSLARAYFILGKVPEGFKVFRILTSRKEVLDMYDVNVALGGVAQVDVQQAMTFLSRMKEAGLQPDGVSFGTVLHHAVLRGNREVTNDMIERIRDLTGDQLSLKTLTNVVHGMLASAKGDTDTDLQWKLAQIAQLIEIYPHINMSSSSQMGKTLVYESLRAKDGTLAYRFWRMFLLRGAQWSDEEQHSLRRAIIGLIRRPEGGVKAIEREQMLVKLGWKEPYHSGRSRARAYNEECL